MPGKRNIDCSCSVCGKFVSKDPRTYKRNKNNYCSRECFDLRRTENLKHIKRHTKYYRDLIKNSSCVGCGEKEYYLLHIHHIDGNDLNNQSENLEIVCANCHIKRHLKYNKNSELVYHPSSLTDRDLLEEL
jgi:5-methylcytosine-specific restriction endonuclease McrA